MSANDKTTQMQIGADASDALGAFDKVKQGAKDMAQTIAKAGEDASKGLERAGDGAGKGAKEVEKADAKIIASIQRRMAIVESAGKGEAAYQEALLRARGKNVDVYKPYLDSLRQAEEAQRRAEGGLQNLGISAKQTTAALRQVPAQFTDIVTSLQGGQAPLTVLLQQGGQLKDVFGGVAPAAKALGGYIVGLINPLTLAAAGAAALAYGFFKGAEEAQAFNKALVLTGNAAGVTVDQLSAMAARMDGLGTTQAKASEGLVAFINAGVKGAAGLERYTLAAIKLEQVGGPAVAETAKAFAELGKDPLKAALKLDEATNFLTRSTYEQIRSLEEQGRTVEAARVAQDALASSIEQATPKIIERLGYIERAWRAVKQVIGEVGDGIASIGREEAPNESVGRQIAQLRNKRKSIELLPGRDADRQRAEIDGRLKALQDEQALLQENERFMQRIAGLQAEQAATVKAKAKFDEDGLRYLDKEARLQREIAQAIESGKRAKLDQSEIDARVTAIKAAARDKKADNALTRELEAQKKLLAEVNGLSGTFYEDWRRLSELFKGGAFKSVEEFEKAQKKILDEQPFAKERAKAAKEEADAAKKIGEEWLKAAESYQKWIAELNKGGDSVEAQIQKLQDEADASRIAAAENISLAVALEKVAIARLRAKFDASASDQERAALRREIELREKLIGEIGKKDYRGQTDKLFKELDKQLDPTRADEFGAALSKAFEGAANGVARMTNALANFGVQQAKLERLKFDALLDGSPRSLLAVQKLNEQSQRNTIGLYASMAGAAKGFFNEGTKGYKALEIAETAFRAYQLAGDFARGTSAATVAVANQASGGDPYTAFARMAAMAATMASLGYQVAGFFGGGSKTGGDGAKQATGQGTVLGDAKAQSESISKSIDLLSDTAKLQLTTQSGMLSALRNIENSIGGVTNQILRINAGSSTEQRLGITTGTTGPSLFGKGFTGGPLNLDNILFGGKITNALFGKTTKVTGSGLFAAPQDLGSILASGLNLKDFADVNSTRKFFGITVSNKNSTTYKDADPALQRQFGQIFRDFADTITLAAKPLDFALGDVKSAIDGFVIDIGKIDFTGLKGDEIAEKLGAVIGAEGDKIAQAAIPGLQDFQRVGEGYFETVVRVASGVETADAALELLGIGAIKFGDVARKQGDISTEIVRQSIAAFESLDGSLSSIGAIINNLDGSADDLADTYRSLLDVRDALMDVGESGDALTAIMIRGAGGLDNLAGGLSSYFENFFSEEEQTSARLARLSEDFARIGVTDIPKTREEFRKLVEGIDTSTDAGQKFFAQVISLSDSFASAVPAAEALQEAVKSLDYVMTASGRFDAKAFSTEVAKVTTDDIQQSILQLNAADRERAQLNFDVGSASFLGAYANSLASQRLTKSADNAAPYGNGNERGQAGFSPMDELRQKEIDALKALQDSMRRLDESLGSFIDDLTFGADSFLSPEQKFLESKSAFESVLKQAKAGDQAAQEQVQARAQAFAEANNAYFGSNQQGTDNLRAMVEELQSLREQVRKMADTAEHGNRIAANGFSGVKAATEEGAALTGQALARARLQSLAKVGFES